MQKNDIYFLRGMYIIIAAALTVFLIYSAETRSHAVLPALMHEAEEELILGDDIDDENVNSEYITDDTDELPSLRNTYARVVYIDPGHGGIDDGVVRSGVSEKDVNLSVALMLRDLILESGVDIYPVMSRSTDVFIDKYDRAVEGSQQADIIVSIHNNSFEQAGVRGTETHYNPSQSLGGGSRLIINSTTFAEIMQRNVVESAGSRDRGLHIRDDLALMNNSTIPCVLVEMGYITNPDERGLLTDEDYQRKLAEGLYNGILEVFGLNASDY